MTVIKVLHSRQGVETWVTSDGRAYFVELDETSPSDVGGVDQRYSQVGPIILQELKSIYVCQKSGRHESGVFDSPPDIPRSQSHFRWRGTCIHDFETPKWVQKRRRRDPEDEQDTGPVYDEPRRAVAVAINGKFSLTAVGAHRSVSP